MPDDVEKLVTKRAPAGDAMEEARGICEPLLYQRPCTVEGTDDIENPGLLLWRRDYDRLCERIAAALTAAEERGRQAERDQDHSDEALEAIAHKLTYSAFSSREAQKMAIKSALPRHSFYKPSQTDYELAREWWRKVDTGETLFDRTQLFTAALATARQAGLREGIELAMPVIEALKAWRCLCASSGQTTAGIDAMLIPAAGRRLDKAIADFEAKLRTLLPAASKEG